MTAIQERLYCVKRLDFYLDTLNLDEPGEIRLVQAHRKYPATSAAAEKPPS